MRRREPPCALLRSAIETGLRERKFDDLSSLRIADGAGLPIEAFMELFPDPRACYLEALDVLGDELLQLIASPDLVSAQWPAAVCHTIDALLAYLARSPARLVTLTVKALEAGPATIANVGDLAYEVATLLTEGAPRRPRTRVAVEGIAGALWYILYCEALAGRGHRLPLLSEYVSYVVLTPYLGPEAAVRAIVQSQAAGRRAIRAAARATCRCQHRGEQRHAARAAASNGATHRPTGPEPPRSPGRRDRNGSATMQRRQRSAGRTTGAWSERRSAKCVSTTPTSTESTITTIKGA